jgi:hypothetical protein
MKANLKKAKVFQGSQPPHPAADDFIHGLLEGCCLASLGERVERFAAESPDRIDYPRRNEVALESRILVCLYSEILGKKLSTITRR